jgi:hypothetical protein
MRDADGLVHSTEEGHMEGNEVDKRVGETAPEPKVRSKAMPEGLKGWLVASLVILLASLLVFVIDVVMGFTYFTQKTTPLWVTAVGGASVLGMGLGFVGLCMVFLMAVVKFRRED